MKKIIAESDRELSDVREKGEQILAGSEGRRSRVHCYSVVFHPLPLDEC
jgi:hypothetical protein